ncbi:hypothetical protein PhCBS80983_g01522 [Powellomyces hirtus]|uniref:Guanylyl cyclase n=1 Tax=Powellomyces hirtus TaxID=109895 RepID=A0A507EBT6_9FUNG|nr:hypothetical protein PhCBS80983_g01522 [Powellomyces hirtus]
MSLVDHIPHRRQLSNWDCGLACVSMVLASLHHPHTLLGLRGSNAVRDGVWTIDLAYLLRKYGIDDFTYYTSYIGVNQQYNRTQFYSATISHDRSRVHSLFAGAHDNNVRVVAWTLPIDDMIRFLDSNRYAIIILVDLNLLHCRNCKKARARKSYQGVKKTDSNMVLCGSEREKQTQAAWSWWWWPWAKSNDVAPASALPMSKSSLTPPLASPSSRTPSHYHTHFSHHMPPPQPSCLSSLFSCFFSPPPSSSPYSSSLSSSTPLSSSSHTNKHSRSSKSLAASFVGHYILLVGYDPDSDRFTYRDPGTDHEMCTVDADALHEARRAPGTDCDVIVVRVR